MRSIASSPFVRRTVVAGLLVVLVLVVAYFSWTSRTQAAPAQPVPFPHVRMVQVGVQCLFCHSDATRSPVAGIPSVEKCVGCHRVIANDRPAIREMMAYWDRQEPIPWVRVVNMPEFVQFSHQVHVAGGLNCERCHGDVGRMEVTQQVTNMNMGWCLNCHRQQPNSQQLLDCVVCHY